MASRCCFPAHRRTILPLPVTRNRFADALTSDDTQRTDRDTNQQKAPNNPMTLRNQGRDSRKEPCASSSCSPSSPPRRPRARWWRWPACAGAATRRRSRWRPAMRQRRIWLQRPLLPRCDDLKRVGGGRLSREWQRDGGRGGGQWHAKEGFGRKGPFFLAATTSSELEAATGAGATKRRRPRWRPAARRRRIWPRRQG